MKLFPQLFLAKLKGGEEGKRQKRKEKKNNEKKAVFAL